MQAQLDVLDVEGKPELKNETYAMQNQISELRLRYKMAYSKLASPKPDDSRTYPTPGPFSKTAGDQLRPLRIMFPPLYNFILDIELEAASLREAHQILETSGTYKGDVETLSSQEKQVLDISTVRCFKNDRNYTKEELKQTEDSYRRQTEVTNAMLHGMRVGRRGAYAAEMLAAKWRAVALARPDGGDESTAVSAQHAGAKRARPDDEDDDS